jgi:hypothetical protein
MRHENGDWPDRTLFFQWHRGDAPELYRNSAVRNQRYKLVGRDELYDLLDDPGENENIAAANPEVVARMRKQYEDWFRDVSNTRGYAPPRIHLGTPHENPVTLTRQDWRGSDGWDDDKLGFWEVKVTETGKYNVTLRFPTTKAPKEAFFRFGKVQANRPLKAGEESCTFAGLELESGDGRLEAWLSAREGKVGAKYVDVNRVR